ncbi:MAG: restriction endonuclease subunit S [Anaerolineae bacterium]
MVGERRYIAVGDFAPFAYGKGLPEVTRNSAGAVPVFGSNGIVGHHDTALTAGPTVVIGRKGTVGAVHYSPTPCWPIDTTFFVSGFDEQSVRFRYYALKSLGLEHMNADSAVPGLNRDAAHARMLSVPENEAEQRAIAHILGTLDDKIELNRRMNETLEAMARALFKSWFVHFDPVRAKVEGRDTGLPREIADLFPDGFEESAVEEVPRGWKIGSILECTDLLSGGTPSTSIAAYWGGNVPWVSAKDVSAAGGLFVMDTERKITDAGVKNSSTKLLPKNTTIVTARGTVGSYCLLGREMAMNQTNYGLKAKPGVGDFFVFFSLVNLVTLLQQQAYGTIFDTVTTKTFQSAAVVHPNHSLLLHFEQQVTPLMDRIWLNLKQSRTLAALRDTLLPKLLSGEVRVGDAARFVEAGA